MSSDKAMRELLAGPLLGLCFGESSIRDDALKIVSSDGLSLHLLAIEAVMGMIDTYRQISVDDEDDKVLVALCIRMCNNFGVATKVALIGYCQSAAMLIRDALETTFLLEMFVSDRARISAWRTADRKSRMRNFGPVHVRQFLDARDGFNGLKRAEHYELLSEMAGHATMQSFSMLRPNGQDIRIGPFVDRAILSATMAETAKVALLLGDIVRELLPNCAGADDVRRAYADRRNKWLATFYID